MLKRSVFPEDIAEAIYFLASDMSAKSTGNIINVDAGNAQSRSRAEASDDQTRVLAIRGTCRRACRHSTLGRKP